MGTHQVIGVLIFAYEIVETVPKLFDLCDKPAEKLVWWADVNANPNTQWSVVKAWQERFIKMCTSVGKGRTFHFGSGTNPQAGGGPATVAVWGCCCEPCKQ